MTARLRSILRPAALFGIILFGGVLGLHALALAQGTAPAAAPVTIRGLPWSAWIAIGLGAFAGIRAIVDVLLAFFKVEAPLTATTLDDRARDEMQRIHDKLDKLAGSLNGLVDASKPAGGVRVLPGSGTTSLVAILLIGALAMPALTACGGSQSTRATTIASLDSGIQTATAALRSFEHEHALAIVSAAPDLTTGRARLLAFRAQVDKAWLAVDAARAAIDAANTVNDDPSLSGARSALNDAITAITALTGSNAP